MIDNYGKICVPGFFFLNKEICNIIPELQHTFWHVRNNDTIYVGRISFP